MAQRAWAVWDNAQSSFLVRTISETVVGAKVNWLAIRAGFLAPPDISEDLIHQTFDVWLAVLGADVAVTEVEIGFPDKGGLLQ